MTADPDDEQKEAAEPNSLQDFSNRFWALQEEAKTYGIRSIVGLLETNPFTLEDTGHFQYCGGYYAAFGMVSAAKARMERDA